MTAPALRRFKHSLRGPAHLSGPASLQMNRRAKTGWDRSPWSGSIPQVAAYWSWPPRRDVLPMLLECQIRATSMVSSAAAVDLRLPRKSGSAGRRHSVQLTCDDHHRGKTG